MYPRHCLIGHEGKHKNCIQHLFLLPLIVNLHLQYVIMSILFNIHVCNLSDLWDSLEKNFDFVFFFLHGRNIYALICCRDK